MLPPPLLLPCTVGLALQLLTYFRGSRVLGGMQPLEGGAGDHCLAQAVWPTRKFTSVPRPRALPGVDNHVAKCPYCK